MNFKDAVRIGLNLDLADDNSVTVPPERVYCANCRADYMTTDWRDKVGCKWCYSSETHIVNEKES